MKAIEVAAFLIINFMGIYFLLMLIGLIFGMDEYGLDWKGLVKIVCILILLLSAFGVLAHKAYAWWVCELILPLFVAYDIYSTVISNMAYPELIFAVPLIDLFLALLYVVEIISFIIYLFNPPWKWLISDQEKIND